MQPKIEVSGLQRPAFVVEGRAVPFGIIRRQSDVQRAGVAAVCLPIALERRLPRTGQPVLHVDVDGTSILLHDTVLLRLIRIRCRRKCTAGDMDRTAGARLVVNFEDAAPHVLNINVVGHRDRRPAAMGMQGRQSGPVARRAFL